MTINAPPESGTRLFRWAEPRNNRSLYYTTWFYFPQRYSVSLYWNIFQWKSRSTSGGHPDPFYVLNVGNRSDGSMYLYLYDWQRRISYHQSIKNIPVGQWFEIKAYYTCSSSGTGRVTFWQDGTQLFDLNGVNTAYSDNFTSLGSDCEWSVDNYSSGVSPSPTVIYADDAAIARP